MKIKIAASFLNPSDCACTCKVLYVCDSVGRPPDEIYMIR